MNSANNIQPRRQTGYRYPRSLNHVQPVRVARRRVNRMIVVSESETDSDSETWTMSEDMIYHAVNLSSDEGLDSEESIQTFQCSDVELSLDENIESEMNRFLKEKAKLPAGQYLSYCSDGENDVVFNKSPHFRITPVPEWKQEIREKQKIMIMIKEKDRIHFQTQIDEESDEYNINAFDSDDYLMNKH